MRTIVIALALNVALVTGCQYTPPEDADTGATDTSDNNGNDSRPNDTSDTSRPSDTSTNNPPAGNTSSKVGFSPIASVKGVKVYCQLESDLRRGAILFVDGNEVINKLSTGGALGYVPSDRVLTVGNSDALWCQGFVTTDVNPPVWNKLLLDDRANVNNPTEWGDLVFDGWECTPKPLVHNEPPSADNSWDTQWGYSCTW